MLKLLVDFGASRIKSVVYDTILAKIIDSAEIASPSQVNHSTGPAFTVPTALYKDAFANTAGVLIAKHEQIEAIYICCEMHGFTMDGDYISWKDSRANLQLVNKLDFHVETGMMARPGLAYCTLKTLMPVNKHIGTIVDSVLDEVIGNDITLTASQGFVSKHTKQISKKTLDEFNSLIIVPLARGHIGSYRGLPVYGGLGDLQAALLGAGLGHEASMVVNLGTGSQVATITDDLSQGDLRPYDGDKWIRVLSHIPAGRALNTVAEIIEPNRFWSLWKDLSADAVVSAEYEQVDLNLFASAWQYTNNSGFIKLKENQTIKELVTSIAATWTRQYTQAIRMLSQGRQHKIAVTGGLAHKSPWLMDSLTALSTEHEFFQPKLTTGEETLDGLLKI